VLRGRRRTGRETRTRKASRSYGPSTWIVRSRSLITGNDDHEDCVCVSTYRVRCMDGQEMLLCIQVLLTMADDEERALPDFMALRTCCIDRACPFPFSNKTRTFQTDSCLTFSIRRKNALEAGCTTQQIITVLAMR